MDWPFSGPKFCGNFDNFIILIIFNCNMYEYLIFVIASRADVG